MSEHIEAVIGEVVGEIGKLQGLLNALYAFRDRPAKLPAVPRGTAEDTKTTGPKPGRKAKPETKRAVTSNGGMGLADALREFIAKRKGRDFTAAQAREGVQAIAPHLEEKKLKQVSIYLCDMKRHGHLTRTGEGQETLWKAAEETTSPTARQKARPHPDPLAQKREKTTEPAMPEAGGEAQGQIDPGEHGGLIKLMRGVIAGWDKGTVFTRAKMIEAARPRLTTCTENVETKIGLKLWELADEGLLAKRGFGPMAEFTVN